MNLLTTTQAAIALGLQRRAVQAMISKGTLPAQRLGRDYMIRPADVERAKQRKFQGRGRKPQGGV